MAKEQLTEEKIGKFISFIMGYIVGGQAEKIIPKVSQDKELSNKIRAVDTSYKSLRKYMIDKYGKDFVVDAEKKAAEKIKNRSY